MQRPQRATNGLKLVSDEDVLAAVENAENLWAVALEARKKADALSEEAETGASASADLADEATTKLKSKKFGLAQIAAARMAMDSSLDLGNLMDRALDAADEADRLEVIAEEALLESEKALDQHVIDFPDSPLAK
eukprot:CAMPEP_0195518264 /NCGR_PEP_ID=MMETSP0794_2-20130614/12648_1 /TAXON_ID=515487 /ORGANISM="Stephanopyxis turris, Strain CCMP 815" /LENGTH=134 /DNA_ID=CAMNT_0040647203 /DNA_START=182 /DNA_END=586 /DNA_ORIENTATION=+